MLLSGNDYVNCKTPIGRERAKEWWLPVVVRKMAFFRGTARAGLVCVFVFFSGIVILFVLFFLVSNNTPDLGVVGEGGRAGMLSLTAHERRLYVDLKGVEEL